MNRPALFERLHITEQASTPNHTPILQNLISEMETYPIKMVYRCGPDKPWKWYYVSLNPNITWEIDSHFQVLKNVYKDKIIIIYQKNKPNDHKRYTSNRCLWINII